MEELITFALLINVINLQAIRKDFFYLWAKEIPLKWKNFLYPTQFGSRYHMQTPYHTILQTRQIRTVEFDYSKSDYPYHPILQTAVSWGTRHLSLHKKRLKVGPPDSRIILHIL